MTDPVDAMAAHLEKNTGHSLEWWIDRALASGKDKHAEMRAHLMAEDGLTYGYANIVAHRTREAMAGGPLSADDLVTQQYRGRESLRPICERLLAEAVSFGDDVEVAPKKASVSLRRSKQFALVEPATKTRIDLGLNLRGEPGTDRLRVAGGMCTHKVAITDVGEVDDELIGWMREAYEQA